MIDFIWSTFMGLAWLVVAVWMIPTTIAYKRDHRNKTVIFVMSIIISILPTTAIVVVGYILLLGFSLYRSPEVMVVQGPKGDPGEPGRDGRNGKDGRRGKDADEIPLSKSGVLKPKRS